MVVREAEAMSDREINYLMRCGWDDYFLKQTTLSMTGIHWYWVGIYLAEAALDARYYEYRIHDAWDAVPEPIDYDPDSLDRLLEVA